MPGRCEEDQLEEMLEGGKSTPYEPDEARRSILGTFGTFVSDE